MIVAKIVGGLGNQLFEYAAARALALHFKTDLKLDLSFFNEPKFKVTYRLDKFNLPFTVATEIDYSKLKNCNKIPKPIRVLKRLGIKIYPYYKKTHIIEQQVLELYKRRKNINTNYYIEGWLANEIYFKNIRKTLLDELNADYYLKEDNMYLNEEIENNNSVAVHIRRGEYLSNSYFKLLPTSFYENAIKKAKKIFENPTFYFFSDDIKWVKNEFSQVANAVFVDNNSIVQSFYNTVGDIEDLMLMRKCKHQIIANSTFSWWGAWLNKNPSKLVIAPKQWFTNQAAQKRYEKGNLIPKKWIKI